MTPLQINLADIAIVDASERVRTILNELGQDAEFGYRKTLGSLLTKSSYFGEYLNPAEKIIIVLNVVVSAIDFQNRLSNEQILSLCSFFIERQRHM